MQSAPHRRYALILLTAILAFAFVDRVTLGLLLQEIKVDLHLNDTQLGLLSGIAFALFYSIMGIPVARWADRGNRVAIIALTAALWSAAVALCGVAGTFAQLMLIRIVVGVGEAGAFPCGLSLIADYFNRADRPRAVAIYVLAGPLSLMVGFLLSGWLNELYGWRMTFVLIGAPGLVLGAIAWLTLREPRLVSAGLRAHRAEQVARRPSEQPDLKEVCATLWANVTFRHLLVAFSVLFFFIYGSAQWQPSYFIRSFGLTSGQVGAWFALIIGSAGLLGTYLGGELAARFAASNERRQLRAIASIMVGCGVFSVAVFLSSNVYVAFGMLAGVSLTIYLTNGPLYAIIQTLVPERMRAVSIAVVMLFANLIGMGLGPLATGVLSDLLQPSTGEESLRYALLIMSPGYLLVAGFAWQASRTVARDLAVVRTEDPAELGQSPSAIRSL